MACTIDYQTAGRKISVIMGGAIFHTKSFGAGIKVVKFLARA